MTPIASSDTAHRGGSYPVTFLSHNQAFRCFSCFKGAHHNSTRCSLTNLG